MTARRTYVVKVREPNGHATVEDVRTGRTARIRSPRKAVEQIERWLAGRTEQPEDRVRDPRESGR